MLELLDKNVENLFIAYTSKKCDPWKAERVIIHGFSDASKKAVAVAVYLVSYYKEMESESRLLVAKSRIAPRDTIVPRLELIGAHMLSRLRNHIKNTLTDNKICEYHGWVDSTTVLHWLQDQGKWTRFVKNRTQAIQQNDFINWYYVPTEENPADLGSRGISPAKVKKFWFHGPT